MSDFQKQLFAAVKANPAYQGKWVYMHRVIFEASEMELQIIADALGL